jgi:hypothetical protein
MVWGYSGYLGRKITVLESCACNMHAFGSSNEKGGDVQIPLKKDEYGYV